MTDAADLIAALRTAGHTVATAESLTGGGLCARLTAVPGASDVVRGGLIVYCDELKVELAGVPQELLDEKGAVNPDVALLLAEGARERCGATWGVGLTGVAGPGPSDGIPAGTVYVAVVGPSAYRCTKLQASGGRDQVREKASALAIDMLREQFD